MTISTTGQCGTLLGILFIVALLAGCSVPAVRVLDAQAGDSGIPSFISFIQDGVTTRDDVRAKLERGPRFRFEGGRIEIYNIGSNKDMCSLVLVFGADDIVQRHSLVGTR